VCSYPNEICIVHCEIIDNNLSLDKDGALIIHCNAVKKWFVIFESYLCEDEFKPTSLAYFDSDKMMKFTKNNFKLEIQGNHVAKKFSFNKFLVLDIMNAISYMYVSSLCLNPPCTLILNALLNHFEYKLNQDFEATDTYIAELSQSEFLDLIKDTLTLYSLSHNHYSICSTLIRYKTILHYVCKLRCYSKKLNI